MKIRKAVGGLGGRCLKFEMSDVQMGTSARQMGTEIWSPEEVYAAGLHVGVTGVGWVTGATTPDEISKGVRIAVPTLCAWAGDVQPAKSLRTDL